MNILFTVTVFTIFLKNSLTASSENSLVEEKSTKLPNKENDGPSTSRPESWDDDINSLWIYRPDSRTSDFDAQSVFRRNVLRQPHAVTKLIKTLSRGFNPQILQEELDPFERRQKLVTLVGLRKNGYFPRQTIKKNLSGSAEVAELQSPYNDIGMFWSDAPGSP